MLSPPKKGPPAAIDLPDLDVGELSGFEDNQTTEPGFDTRGLEIASKHGSYDLGGGDETDPAAEAPLETLEAVEELTEIATLEEMPAEPENPAAHFDELPTVETKPAASAVTAKELSDEILGGVDFELPAAPATPAPTARAMPTAPKPTAPSASPKPTPAKTPTPGASSAFKPITPTFKSSPAASPFSAPTPAGSPASGAAASVKSQAKPAAPAPVNVNRGLSLDDIDELSLGNLDAIGEAGPPPNAQSAPAANPAKEALRQALTAPTAPKQLPADASLLIVHLCRALIAKGVISADEILQKI